VTWLRCSPDRITRPLRCLLSSIYGCNLTFLRNVVELHTCLLSRLESPLYYLLVHVVSTKSLACIRVGFEITNSERIRLSGYSRCCSGSDAAVPRRALLLLVHVAFEPCSLVFTPGRPDLPKNLSRTRSVPSRAPWTSLCSITSLALVPSSVQVPRRRPSLICRDRSQIRWNRSCSRRLPLLRVYLMAYSSLHLREDDWTTLTRDQRLNASTYAFLFFKWPTHRDGQPSAASSPNGPFGNLKIKGWSKSLRRRCTIIISAKRWLIFIINNNFYSFIGILFVLEEEMLYE
jgi:hypothetical protein